MCYNLFNSLLPQGICNISTNQLCTGEFVFLQGVFLAKKFEEMVLEDDRFEIPAPRYLGMVVFSLKVRE